MLRSSKTKSQVFENILDQNQMYFYWISVKTSVMKFLSSCWESKVTKMKVWLGREKFKIIHWIMSIGFLLGDTNGKQGGDANETDNGIILYYRMN